MQGKKSRHSRSVSLFHVANANANGDDGLHIQLLILDQLLQRPTESWSDSEATAWTKQAFALTPPVNVDFSKV